MPRWTGIALRFIRPTWRFWSVAATSALDAVKTGAQFDHRHGPLARAEPITGRQQPAVKCLRIEYSLQILVAPLDLPPLTEARPASVAADRRESGAA